MAHKLPCQKYTFVKSSVGQPGKFVSVDEPCKDEESPADYNTGGYLPVKVNDIFNNRYRVVRKLGWGHFSTVWLVRDDVTQDHSALKVVKSAGRYAETARDEIKLLSRVASVSPLHPGRQHIVSFLDSFSHQGPEASHVCIVFEPLGENLLALIERNKKKGVPRSLVKVIAKQVLLGLEYLHDECDLVHTDIKPENILISIPDIEAHIQSELAQSPSPTSRRVGVPLPTKTRTGVTIPYSQHRARKQVQIFESQPLSSPGRSLAGSLRGHPSVSAHRQDNSGSGSLSLNGSYIAQMHMTRSNNTTFASFVGGTAGSLSSSAPKVPSCLSASAPRSDPIISQQRLTQMLAAKGITAVPPRVLNTPSTSSSSSSVSSAVVSVTGGSSSIVSTPPTSISHSLGNAMMEFLGTVKPEVVQPKLSPPLETGPNAAGREGLLVPPSKSKLLEKEITSAISTSWKDEASSSWKDKIVGSFSSNKSNKSNGSSHNASKQRSSAAGHHRSHSGLSSHVWKDPGTAAPAPTVVVSAVVSTDGIGGGLENGFPKLSLMDNHKSNSASSSSSTTTTLARPSPTTTPVPIAAKPGSTRSGLSKSVNESSQTLNAHDHTTSHAQDTLIVTPTSCSTQQAVHHPSLLTQTAPSRHSPATSPAQTISPIQNQPQGSTVESVPAQKSNSVTQSQTAPDPPRQSPLSSSNYVPAIVPSVLSLFNSSTAAEVSQPQPIPRLHTPTADDKPAPPPISIKIADLGNATPSKKHFTEDIQTRQYRAPEAILGRRDWDARADIWSVACVVFELLTAEYLFDPQGQGELFTKDDDHMAQIIELMGDFPLDVKMGGKYSRELFDHTGALRYIRTLKPWPLKRVMKEKYLFSEEDSELLCQFLEPMLAPDMRNRANARDLKDHKWLEPTKEDGTVTTW
ncbi:hypothetical protein CVT24_000491 [Panaeolus cyanescens]|uniref:non-specific serine/threonine protein kinase n=1 Tax=Panaeolus cyanescens TaxID=181874 RepID=A0A409VE10_9AGAR|nr:hypothetical protein CVT24_000491 [Panaeolus cyanescens]